MKAFDIAVEGYLARIFAVHCAKHRTLKQWVRDRGAPMRRDGQELVLLGSFVDEVAACDDCRITLAAAQTSKPTVHVEMLTFDTRYFDVQTVTEAELDEGTIEE